MAEGESPSNDSLLVSVVTLRFWRDGCTSPGPKLPLSEPLASSAPLSPSAHHVSTTMPSGIAHTSHALAEIPFFSFDPSFALRPSAAPCGLPISYRLFDCVIHYYYRHRWTLVDTTFLPILPVLIVVEMGAAPLTPLPTCTLFNVHQVYVVDAPPPPFSPFNQRAWPKAHRIGSVLCTQFVGPLPTCAHHTDDWAKSSQMPCTGSAAGAVCQFVFFVQPVLCTAHEHFLAPWTVLHTQHSHAGTYHNVSGLGARGSSVILNRHHQ